MSTHIVQEKFKKFQILWGSGISSVIVMNILTSKINHKNSTTDKWKNQPRKFATTNMANIRFCLPELGGKTNLHVNAMWKTTLKAVMVVVVVVVPVSRPYAMSEL